MSHRFEETSPISPSETEILRQTILAQEMFLNQGRVIPGVQAVELRGEMIQVYVGDRESEAADAVRRLEDQVYEAYPEARILLWLSEAPPPPKRQRFTAAA